MAGFKFMRLSAAIVSVLLSAMAVPSLHASTLDSAVKLNTSGLSSTLKFDRFIVTYRPGSAERITPALASRSANNALRRYSAALAAHTSAAPTATWVRKMAVGADVVRVSRKLSSSEALAYMQQLAADPAVVHVEPDVMMHAVRDLQASHVPTDPEYGAQQWHYSNPVGGVNLPQALDLSDGSGVVVAVIDTGITVHPDLDTSLAADGYDFISDPLISGRPDARRVPGGWDTGDWTNEPQYQFTCGLDEASSWHGTHVAGTVSELTDNGIGLAGMAGRARVLPLRVLGHCGGSTSDIADAVVWAAGGHVDGVPDNTHPAQVINMSLGGMGTCASDDVLGAAIAGALARGTTVVVAAGNSNADASKFSPASCPGVLAVGATGITGKRAYYSNYGSTVGLAAPGGGVYLNDDPATGIQANPNGFVWQSINLGTTVPEAPGYGGYAGTSQATPHVAGTVALMLSAASQAGSGNLSPVTVRTMLTVTARAFPATPDRAIGSGILDAGAAVLAATIGGVPLKSGSLVSNQAGQVDGSVVYFIDVPAGTRTLTVRSSGGTGQTDLAVRLNAVPAVDGSNAAWRSSRPGTTDAIVIASPQAGRYFVRLMPTSAFSGVSVLAAYASQ
jgi:serine protease